jgi:uncharacterized protein (DUF169 family)
MDLNLKDRFTQIWYKYFTNSELPIIFYYENNPVSSEIVKPGSISRCIIGALNQVRNGRSLSFNAESIGCFGGRKYLGFGEIFRPEFNYFLSCGIPGKIEGERYKKSPDLVAKFMSNVPFFNAPERFITFKRWDNLTENDNPEVVIFYTRPDELSGLFTLANFNESKPDAAFAPMGSGCSSIVSYPYKEIEAISPRAVIGMFDISARPHVRQDVLTFSLPVKKLLIMLDNAEESFLTLNSWKTLQKRLVA